MTARVAKEPTFFINAKVQDNKSRAFLHLSGARKQDFFPILCGASRKLCPFIGICPHHMNVFFDFAWLFRHIMHRRCRKPKREAAIGHKLPVKTGPAAMDKNIFVAGLIGHRWISMHALHCFKERRKIIGWQIGVKDFNRPAIAALSQMGDDFCP